MRIWLLICLCLLSGQAAAGLFSDDEARKQIQQLDERVTKLEQALAALQTSQDQSVRSALDLQTQLDSIAADLRNLRGQDEEFVHGLQDAQKRQKDFYVDLDTRLRRLESAAPAPADSGAANGSKVVASDPQSETHAFEAAYAYYKSEDYPNAATAFSNFLKNYPQSVHEANVLYWMGNAYFLNKDFKNALIAYQSLVSKYADHPRVPEAMLNIAECQVALKANANARKTLKQIISQFPGSDASDKAKKRLAMFK